MAEFEIRQFKAVDVFAVAKIVSKSGLSNFKQLVSPENVHAIVQARKNGGEDVDARTVGIGAILEGVEILLGNLEGIEGDIMKWLGSMGGVKDVKNMPADEFVELVYAVFTSDGFADFFTAVSKLAEARANRQD